MSLQLIDQCSYEYVCIIGRRPCFTNKPVAIVIVIVNGQFPTVNIDHLDQSVYQK